MQNKIEKMTFYGMQVFLFCYFMQIFDMPNLITVPIGVLFCLVLIIRQKKLRLDLETCLLMITLGVYFIKDFGLIKAITSPYCYVAPLVYVLAHYLAHEIKSREKSEKILVLVITTMITAITIHGILNSYMFLDGQLMDGNVRVWRDIWSEDFIYGTMQVAFYFPAFIMILPSILCWKKKKISGTFFVLSTVLFLLIAILSLTRMPVLILPIVFAFQFILYVFLEKEKVKVFFTKKRILLLGSILVIGAIGIVIVLCNTSVGASFIRAMGRDGGIFNNIRFKIQRSAIDQLFLYPMGGNLMDHLGYGHTHNAWLDIADIGGLIPFFAFIIYTILTGYEVICLILQKEISSVNKIIFVGLYVVYFLFFTIEPSLDWSVHFMTPWLFLHGLIHGYVKNERRGRKCYFL